MPTPSSDETNNSPSSNPKRILACKQCQQRKVKCNRKFPCASCVRLQLECVPALGPRQRRRRFPERVLLDRIRHYEDLLARNGTPFEPLHPPSHGPGTTPKSVTKKAGDTNHTVSGDGVKIEPIAETVDLGSALRREIYSPGDDNTSPDMPPGDEDDIVDVSINGDVWDRAYHDEQDDQFPFGAGLSDVDSQLHTLHPEQAHIFKLWQVYLENVNPLLRITHTPTLQTSIFNNIGDLSALGPESEALLFSIYCASISSLTDTDCQRLFGSPYDVLLKSYQFACRQALLKCRLLRSDHRDCLTAFFLYLISLGHLTNPQSMASMLAIALHIAQRIGIHLESTIDKHSAFEVEMSRRLWWAMVTFNHRICELSEQKLTMLTPSWDCKMPSNLHDFEIRAEMQTMPTAHEEATEAIFTLIRHHQADYIRNSAFHLNFVNPRLRAMAEPTFADLSDLERSIEEKHLAHCDPSNPVHFMTIWTARGCLARCQLLEYYSQHASTQPTETQRNEAFAGALRMLECDFKLLTSPLAQGYKWFIYFHFPMLAYFHVLRQLRYFPDHEQCSRAWKILDESWNGHATRPKSGDAIAIVCARLVAQAWQACEGAAAKTGTAMETPQIVVDIHTRAGRIKGTPSSSAQGESDVGQSMNTFAVSMSLDDTGQSHGFPDSLPANYFDMGEFPLPGSNSGESWSQFGWMFNG